MAVSQEIEFKVDREKLEWLLFETHYRSQKISRALFDVLGEKYENYPKCVSRLFAEMSDEDLIKVFNAIKI